MIGLGVVLAVVAALAFGCAVFCRRRPQSPEPVPSPEHEREAAEAREREAVTVREAREAEVRALQGTRAERLETARDILERRRRERGEL